ncbi:hypothetical protein hp2018_1103 [Helicobacter pylori 2018]|nr:hypothetical protein hp2017_1099 [Helicobacter pylori 2017]ADZ51817.1 hypothetical protein hp2018_1103 [Helicobacter pylori 2018]
MLICIGFLKSYFLFFSILIFYLLRFNFLLLISCVLSFIFCEMHIRE